MKGHTYSKKRKNIWHSSDNRVLSHYMSLTAATKSNKKARAYNAKRAERVLLSRTMRVHNRLSKLENDAKEQLTVLFCA